MIPHVDIAAASRRAIGTSDLDAWQRGAWREERLPRLRPSHADFLGVPFCLLPLERIVRLIVQTCDAPFGYVVTPNSHHIVTLHEQPAKLTAIYRNAWLSLCDSQIVRRLAALEGMRLPLVTGSDLVPALLAQQNAAAPAERKRILVVGPDGGTAERLRTRYPQVLIEVLPAPARLAQRGNLRLEVACACMARQWDILLLCVGCPAQEMIAALIAERGRRAGIALCVGAAIDFVTGRSTRAPRILRRLGLEWACRLVREPARLWRRYLIESPRILRIFLLSRAARRK